MIARLIFFLSCLVLCFHTPSLTVCAEESQPPLKKIHWSFEGPFGTYDRNALRRGYKVYKFVCATCHAMNLLHFRNLSEEGGPEFTPGQAKTLAAEYKVPGEPDATGSPTERPGLPKDRFPDPFPNEAAARSAMGGALPPDLSLMADAREGKYHYIYSLLTGFSTPPKDGDPEHDPTKHPGLHYNPYFEAGKGWIAMPPPLSDDIVTFDDGSPSDVEHLAADVTHFLVWASDPKLEQRHRLGFQVMIYLAILAVLLYFTVRKLWRDKHH